MAKINVEEKIEEGYIHIRAIVEMLGKPKEHVEETLKLYMDKLAESQDFIVIYNDYSPAEDRDGLFYNFVESEILIKGVENVAWFCFDYMPASIEIIEPTSLKYRSSEMTNFLNDLLGRLHTLDARIKKDDLQLSKLSSNAEGLMKNFLGYLIKDESKDVAFLAKTMGIPESSMESVLNRLIGEEFVEKVDDKYTLTEKFKKKY
jgi:DNA-binding MarR family transcriptional regulator